MYSFKALKSNQILTSLINLPASYKLIHFRIFERIVFLAIYDLHSTYYIIHSMKQQQPYQNPIFHQLKQFGFDDNCIKRALQITNDIQKASQIALKLSDQGMNADLSAYIKPKVQYKLPNKYSRSKMIFIVNGELKMTKAKICTQVSHAVVQAFIQIQEQAKINQNSRVRLESWQMQGTAKIVVKAQSQKQMLQIKDKFQKLNIGINLYLAEEINLKQGKKSQKTVLAIGPAYSQQIDPITIHLKLL